MRLVYGLALSGRTMRKSSLRQHASASTTHTATVRAVVDELFGPPPAIAANHHAGLESFSGTTREYFRV